MTDTAPEPRQISQEELAQLVAQAAAEQQSRSRPTGLTRGSASGCCGLVLAAPILIAALYLGAKLFPESENPFLTGSEAIVQYVRGEAGSSQAGQVGETLPYVGSYGAGSGSTGTTYGPGAATPQPTTGGSAPTTQGANPGGRAQPGFGGR